MSPDPVTRGDRRTGLLHAPAPLRVVVAGAGLEALAGAVVSEPPPAEGLSRDDDHGPRTVDAVLVGSTLPPGRRRMLADDAGALGVPILHPGPRPAIDVRVVNPIGWQRSTQPTIGVYVPNPARQAAWTAATELAERFGRDRVVVLIDEMWGRVAHHGLAQQRLPADAPLRGEVLGALRGVADARGLHAGAPERAAWLVELAARGVPVEAGDLRDLTPRLAPDVVDAIETTRIVDLDDDHVREGVSVRLRRVARRGHAADAVWRGLAAANGLPWPAPPTVSVLLATNRPDRVLTAVQHIDRQRYDRVEIVVAFHGEDPGDDMAGVLRRATDRPLEIVTVAVDRSLGDVLNAATEAASGDLVAKMDDDDLYATDHLDDLVAALHHSGATLVGKGSEFVYLEEVDTTIRRFPTGAETANRNLGGGTLMLARHDLLQVGRWQRAPAAVDQRLIDDILRQGASIHRTHGHGFVLVRHGRGHTWDVPVDYFLRQAVRQWPGLATEAAGIT